jgi:hypothetical protein
VLFRSGVSPKFGDNVSPAWQRAWDSTGKPYLHISGDWIYGNNTAITEDSPFHAPALVAWELPIERRVLDSGRDVRQPAPEDHRVAMMLSHLPAA